MYAICKVLLTACLALLPLAQGLAQQTGSVVGTYRLVSWESRNATTGEVRHLFGTDADGRLTYDAQGNLSIQLQRPNRPLFAANDFVKGTPAEIKAAFEGYFAYYGTYQPDYANGTIVHNIQGASFPNFANTVQKRFFELEGRRYTLRSPPLSLGGSSYVNVLVWERIE